MGQWMRQKGLAFGWFTYSQKVKVYVPKASGSTAVFDGSGGGGGGGGGGDTGEYEYLPMMMPVDGDGAGGGGSWGGGSTALMPANEERLLVWTMNTDQNGRLLFGNPVLVSPTPKTLYVVYTPLRMEAGLPSGWRYPNAGTLFIQTRDQNGDPIFGTDERINVNGAFDAPAEPIPQDESAATSYNAEGAIPCLMDHRTAGCSNTISVRSLMDERGASMALVDYLQKVQPVYDEQPAGSGNLVPRGSLIISKREIQFNGCEDVKYYNEGSFQFELSSTASRYLVAQDGSYGKVAEATATEQSPTATYTGSRVVVPAEFPSLPNYAINPVDPTNPTLVAVSDLTVTSVAAVTRTGNPKATALYRTTGYVATGDNRLAAHVYVGCDSELGTLSVSAGWQDVGANTAYNWSQNVNRYSFGTIFTKGVAANGTVLTREDPSLGYCYGNVYYDGNRTIQLDMSSGCGWGDQLINGNMTTTVHGDPKWAYDGLGSLFPQYCPAGQFLGSAYGRTPKTTWVGGETGWSTTMVTESETGCLYNMDSGLHLMEEDVKAGMRISCSGTDAEVYTGRTREPLPDGRTELLPGESYQYYYTGTACVARSYPTWQRSW
jgi:hypothetical protein